MSYITLLAADRQGLHLGFALGGFSHSFLHGIGFGRMRHWSIAIMLEYTGIAREPSHLSSIATL